MKKEYNFGKGKRGAVVPAPKGKTRITIRIDDDILEWFRGEVEAAGGGNYQTLINQALREYVRQQQQLRKFKAHWLCQQSPSIHQPLSRP